MGSLKCPPRFLAMLFLSPKGQALLPSRNLTCYINGCAGFINNHDCRVDEGKWILGCSHSCCVVISDGIPSTVRLSEALSFLFSGSPHPCVLCRRVACSGNSPSWQFVGVIRAVQQISDGFNRQSHAFYVHRKGGAQT